MQMRHMSLVLIVMACILVPGFSREGGSMQLHTKAFKEEGAIPRKYSCDGEDISPPLSWTEVPQGTQSFVLIADDPDAPGGTWVHWVYYDIPKEVRELPEDLETTEHPGKGGTQGVNDFGNIGYGGPCPPGGEHRYYFKLYALDEVLGLKPGLSKKQVLNKMEGHILEEVRLMGTFTR